MPLPDSLIVDDRFDHHRFESEPYPFRHNLAETGLFDEDALVELVASHPYELVNVSKPLETATEYTWGEGDWRGVDPADLVDLVRRGHLWINVRRLQEHQPAFRTLLDRMYGELGQKCAGLDTSNRRAGLLLSSPTAKVPYHLDLPHVILWHIRGSKRLWVYPHDDRSLMPYEEMEACIAGVGPDDIPYEADFDKLATVVDLHPGMALTWPQTAPHRVENLEGLNVSMTVEHDTPAGRRYLRVHRANRFLRTRMGLPCRSPRVDGFGYRAKAAAYGVARAFGKVLGQRGPGLKQHPMTFKVDPSAEGGIVLLGSEAEPVRTERSVVETA